MSERLCTALWTPLHTAALCAAESAPAVIAALLRAGADARAVGGKLYSLKGRHVDALTGRVYGNGWSALGFAAMLGRAANVQALVAGGADASAQVYNYNYTPLAAALRLDFSGSAFPEDHSGFVNATTARNYGVGLERWGFSYTGGGGKGERAAAALALVEGGCSPLQRLPPGARDAWFGLEEQKAVAESAVEYLARTGDLVAPGGGSLSAALQAAWALRPEGAGAGRGAPAAGGAGEGNVEAKA